MTGAPHGGRVDDAPSPPVTSEQPGELRDRAGDGRDSAGDARDGMAAKRDLAADGRDRTGDERDGRLERRDRSGEARDGDGDERDHAADERDRTGALRDLAAEERDRAAEEFETRRRFWSAKVVRRSALARRAAAADRAGASDDRLAGEGERIDAEQDREAARGDRLAGARQRTSAGVDRTDAEVDRLIAHADRDASALDRQDASVDSLTGVSTRGAGFHALDREIARARRSQQPLLVGFIDVDGLKAVNDGRGHATGDQMLRDVADTLRANLREYDLVFRYGGDEFVCVLSGVVAAFGISRLALVNRSLSSGTVPASVTAGFAELQPEESGTDLVARADTALYRERARIRS